MQRPDLFVPLSVNYVHDPAIRHAGEAAETLYIRALAYARRLKTGGWIPDFDLPVVAVGMADVDRRVKALIEWNLWVEGDGGWQIRSWAKWNDVDGARDKAAETERAKAAERKARQRAREKAAAEKAAAQAVSEPAPSHAVTPDVTRDRHVTVTTDVTRDGGVTKDVEKEREIEKEPSLREGVQPPLVAVVESATATPPHPAKGKPKDEALNPHAAADQIAKDWYERNKTTSAQSYVAVRSIVRPLVARGIEPKLLIAAMDDATAAGFPISGGTLTTAMKRLARPQAASQDPYGNVTPIHQSPATRAASAAMERARRYAEAEGLTLAEALEA